MCWETAERDKLKCILYAAQGDAGDIVFVFGGTHPVYKCHLLLKQYFKNVIGKRHFPVTVSHV